MKSDYITRAQKFVMQFYPYIAEIIAKDGYWDEYENAVYRFNLDKHRKVRMAKGAVRVVFISSDYVIKIDYNERCGRQYGNCESEYQAFQYAKNDGFDYLFAEITRINFHGVNFYIMPRVHVCGKDWISIDEYLTEDEVDYLNEYVADLHEENWGFLHKEVKIIDYACSFDYK